MKLNCIVVLLGSALLSGCAGYNHALFMTKSNAGLDLDMKPPTAEISIARKESVLAPAYEGGKTPPVMASFKPRTEFSGAIQNYFVGVDQTFAGGDAAKTMATLYAGPTPPSNAIEDSTLTLNEPLKQKRNPLTSPLKPGAVRPFIFGTDTSLGLKVAWSGVGGQFPDTVKAGFNRKEFAWAPISTAADMKSVKMPSFLATIQSEIGGDAQEKDPVTGTAKSGHGIRAIQYFATGDSASQLARQKDVRDAMLKRMDPAYGNGAPIGHGPVTRQLLGAMELAFTQLPNDVVAQGHLQRIKNLKGVKIPATFQGASPAMFKYERTAAGNFRKKTQHSNTFGPGGAVRVSDVNAYLSKLENSITTIQQLTAALAATPQWHVDSSPLQNITDAEKIELGAQLQIQQAEVKRFERAVATDKDVEAAFSYFSSLMKP